MTKILVAYSSVTNANYVIRALSPTFNVEIVGDGRRALEAFSGLCQCCLNSF